MLPLTPKFLIAVIASSINDRTTRKLDYALEEVRVLRHHPDRDRSYVVYAERFVRTINYSFNALSKASLASA